MTKHNHFTAFTHDIKKYVKFSNKELEQLLYVMIISAFVFTFNKWGVEYFDLERGLANFFIAIVFLGIFFFGQIYVKKIVGVKLGYDTKYEWSMPGIMVMIVISFLTYGYVPFLLLGHTKIIQNDRRRIGGWRFAINHLDHYKIYLIGYLFNYLLILLILGPLYLYLESHFVMELIKINLALIFFSILPLPKNDGLILFFAHRALYFVVVSFVIIMSLLILWGNIYSFIFAAILALIVARVVITQFHL